MKNAWPCSACTILGLIILALIAGVLLAILMAFVVIMLVNSSTGFEEIFNTSHGHFGSLVSSSATVFSGIIVIAGVILTLQTQKIHAEQERTQKVKSINFSLAGVFSGLADLCDDMLYEVEKSTSVNRKHRLNKHSINTVRIAIENMKGYECEYLCKVMLYYQIVLSIFEKKIPKSNHNLKSGDDENDPKEKNENNNSLIVLLISLKSIAEVCANAAIRGKFDICLNLCKRQFRENLMSHMEYFHEMKFAEKIACKFDLKYCQNMNIFEGPIGFLEDNYLDRYKWIKASCWD